MARPRVFISSTYYDLKQVRADLEHFIREMGYEPVLNERGHIPYGRDKKLEEYCYLEVDKVDILVSIVGGRYGSGSQHQPYSISHVEVKTALEKGRQVYIFVEQSVMSEYRTFLTNKDNDGIKWAHVDNPEVFRFIERLEALPNNNPIAPFEVSSQITTFLKEQWAGLFQRLIQEQSRSDEYKLADQLRSSVRTLNELISLTTQDRKSTDKVIHDILLANHPAFRRLQNIVEVSYRVFFTTMHEMMAWTEAQGFDEVWYSEDGSGLCLSRHIDRRTVQIVEISTGIFDEKTRLIPYTENEWNEDWLQMSYSTVQANIPAPIDDDVDESDPFADE